MITSIAYIMCKQGQQREAYVPLFLAKVLYFQSRVDWKIVIINRRELSLSAIGFRRKKH